MRAVAAAFALLVAGTVPAAEVVLCLPLASEARVERRIDASTRLRVAGGGGGFEIEVRGDRRMPGCFDNLAHRAPHGPDPSEVLPWQVREGRFPDPRILPVCGRRFALEVALVEPVVSEDGERFVSGTLVVAVRPPEHRAPR